MLTSNKGFDELTEKLKSQNKNVSMLTAFRKWKWWFYVLILWKLWKQPFGGFPRDSCFSNVAPATLLKPLSVMGNFLEVFQEITKYSFQYKKHLSGVVYQAYKWHLCICDGGVASFFLRL